MDIVIVLSLSLPFVHCPITSMTTSNGKADFNSITKHITLLEQQVTTLQYEFESELKSTLTELINVKNALKASQGEQIELRNSLRDKCRMLKLTSVELNSTKSEIVRLKKEVSGVKASCSVNSQSVLNVTEIVGAINTTVSFHMELSHTLKNMSDKQVIKFDKAQTNKGGYYNTDSGVFKSPKQGNYMIWANIYLTEPNSFINIFAHRDDTIFAHGHTETSEGSPQGVATVLAVTYLNTGENIWFTKDSGSAVIYGNHIGTTSSYGVLLLRTF